MFSKHPPSLRHPALSLWLSAVHQAIVTCERKARGLHVSARHPTMEAASFAAAAALRADESELGDGAEPSGQLRASAMMLMCARLFTRRALAVFHGNAQEAERVRDQLRYLPCDPLWLEAWTTFEAARLELHPARSYRRHQSLEDFVLAPLPDVATVALLADWGTGMPDARGLLEQVARFEPDAVLHLGDIYYAGTPHEVHAHFLDLFEEVFGPQSRVRVYTLAGNHDRYSGGEGFSTLLDALGQPASYFSLANRHWQFLAMDTGLHDFNPRAHGTTATWLEASEEAWLQHKLRQADAEQRGTVLLSHHPLFSFAGTGRTHAGALESVNPKLHAAFAPFFPGVAWWFWGHEHNLVLYEPYAQLARGRCIGAAAVPRLVHEQVNAPVPGLQPGPDESGLPRRIRGTSIRNDGVEDFHGYAVLRLDGPTATAEYYQVSTAKLEERPVAPAPLPFYTEQVRLSRR